MEDLTAFENPVSKKRGFLLISQKLFHPGFYGMIANPLSLSLIP